MSIVDAAFAYTPTGWDVEYTLTRISSNYCKIMKERACCKDCTLCTSLLISTLKKETTYWSRMKQEGNPKARNWASYWGIVLRSLARETSERIIERKENEEYDIVPQTGNLEDVLNELANLDVGDKI